MAVSRNPRKDAFDFCLHNMLIELLDAHNSESEDEIMEDGLIMLVTIESTRYLTERVPVPKTFSLAADLLPSYDSVRFRRTIRTDRTYLDYICNLIKDHDVFENNFYPVVVQLAIVLHRFGTFGNAASVMSIARNFGIGDGGTITIFTQRIITALLSVEKKFIFWPSSEERRSFSNYMTSKCIPQCIGFVDGTHVALETAPRDDPISYYNRKGFYSLNLQLISDPFRRILAYHVGQPGKVHDSKVYGLTSMARNPHQYFGEDEFIIGDAAYSLTTTLITPFRKTRGFTQQQEKFNHHISKQRMVIEHVNGILKSRFQSIRGLRMIVDRKSGHKYACEWVVACLILYNILLMIDPWEEELLEDVEVNQQDDDAHIHDNTNHPGQNKRNALMEYILAHIPR